MNDNKALTTSDDEIKQRLHSLEALLAEKENQLCELQSQFAESNIRLFDALESLSEGFCLLNKDLEVFIVNPSIHDLFLEYSEEIWAPGNRLIRCLELLAQAGFAFSHNNNVTTAFKAFQIIRDDRSVVISLSKNDSKHMILNARPTFDDGLVITIQNITDLKKKEGEIKKSAVLINSIYNSIGQGICAFDSLGRLTSWNQLFSRMLDLPEDFLVAGEYRSGALRDLILQAMALDGEALEETAEVTLPPLGLRIENAEFRRGERHLLLQQFDMPDGGLVSTLTDITERKQAELLLLQKATVDALTGMANRASGLDQLDAALARAQREQSSMVGVLYMDLDGFKNVNDTFGHAAGDQLIIEASQRMKAELRRSDTLSRLGGDEFLIILPDIKDHHHCSVVVEKLLISLRKAFYIDGNEIFISCSAGIAISPHDGSEASILLRNADLAMYASKSSGKNTFRHFSSRMNEQLRRQLELEQAFRKALDGNELCLNYQPIVNVHDGSVLGAEALIRWDRPGVGRISPDQFIPVIEETGLIVPMGAWVIRQACRDAVIWRKATGKPLVVSVNVSPRQFRNKELLNIVRDSLEHTGLPPHCLRLEVTENLFALGTGEIVRTMLDLQSIGVDISMDDFGTGYSSLSYLKEFPFKSIKIDKVFVMGMTENDEDHALTRTIIGMAKSLKLGVVAEGVESKDQLELLRQYNCDWAQGYYFGRPQTSADFGQYAAQN